VSYEIRVRKERDAWPLGGGGLGQRVDIRDCYPGHIEPDKPTLYIVTNGIDFGGGESGYPRVISEPAPGWYVIKEPGATGWSGRGTTSYAVTEYHVLQAVHTKDGVRRWGKWASVKPGKFYRRAIKELEALALSLSGESE